MYLEHEKKYDRESEKEDRHEMHPLHGHKLSFHHEHTHEGSKINYAESKAHHERAEHPKKITHL